MKKIMCYLLIFILFAFMPFGVLAEESSLLSQEIASEENSNIELSEESQPNDIKIDETQENTQNQFNSDNQEDSISLSKTENKKYGWQTINGKIYYFYENGVRAQGITLINGKRYFFGEVSGQLKYNFVTAQNGKVYYTGNDGIVRTGFQKINEKTYYFNEEGIRAQGITSIGGKRYFFGEISGQLKYNFVTAQNGQIYYTGNDGIVRTGITPINGKRYFFGEISGQLKYNFVTAQNGDVYYAGNDGIVRTGFQKINGQTYYFGEGGIRAQGITPIGNKQYFFGEISGQLKYNFVTAQNGDVYYTGNDGIVRTGFQKINGQTYYFNAEGVRAQGITPIDNKRYFFGEISGQLKYNFVTAQNGKVYYAGNDGIVRTGFQKINGQTYYFGEEGIRAQGITPIGNKRYFFGEISGQLKYNFVTAQNGKVYYTGNDGIIQTGFQKINDQTYYFDEEGVRAQGITTIEEKKYFFKENSGQLQYNFVTAQNGKVYYTADDGIVRTGTITIDGLEYNFTNTGILLAGWQYGNGKTYYIQTNGKHLVGWHYVMGQKCFFNSLGELIGKNVKRIIDVSKYQGTIDWDSLWNAKLIDGAIIRIGVGSTIEDAQLANNIAALKRLGIPYGIYLFSYAENNTEAIWEADFTNKLINKYKMNPQLGIYLDIEKWSEHPDASDAITPAMYEGIILNYINKMKTYGKVAKVYTGKNYALNRLTEAVRNHITWMAQYNHTCTYPGTYRIWQYGSEYYPGITGEVDTNVMFY